MKINDEQVKELIAEAKADEVGLWFIIAKIRDECGVSDRAELRFAALDCIRKLLDSGEIAAGYYSPDGKGIHIWKLSPADIILRITAEWDALEHEPNIGDIVVFVGR